MEIHDEHGHPAGVVTADGAGRYRFNLLPGRYFVSPAGSQGLKRDNRFPVALARGRTTNLDLVADPLPLPDALNKTLKVYDGLRSYSDVTIIRTSMGHINNLLSMEFAWAQSLCDPRKAAAVRETSPGACRQQRPAHANACR